MEAASSSIFHSAIAMSDIRFWKTVKPISDIRKLSPIADITPTDRMREI
jgi:hypothetical protein